MKIFNNNPITLSRPSTSKRGSEIRISKRLIEISSVNPDKAYEILNSTKQGISKEEAEDRLNQFGFNEIAREKTQKAGCWGYGTTSKIRW
jgi:Cation transporter/ATPase, N-terminus.